MCAEEFDLNKRNTYESGRITRRAALKRLGITAGMAVFSLLTVDDLARIAAKKLKDERMCDSLANEFKDAGVAVAQISVGSCEVQCDDEEQIQFLRCAKNDNPLNIDCSNGNNYLLCGPYNTCIALAEKAHTDCYVCCESNGTDCYDDS